MLTKNNKNIIEIDGVSVDTLLDVYGSPLYIYSKSELLKQAKKWQDNIRAQDYACFAVKANSNLSLLKLLSELGFGFDIVSTQELNRVKLVHKPLANVVFSGVAKTYSEILEAAQNKILSINIESESEFELLKFIAGKHKVAINFTVRVNPNITVDTHSKIATANSDSKFGIQANKVLDIYRQSKAIKNLNAIGIASHIGSQLQSKEPLLKSVQVLIKYAETLRNEGIQLKFIDVGGGYSIKYRNEKVFNISQYIKELNQMFADLPYNIVYEPGRSIIASCGFILTQVQHLKVSYNKNYALVDAGMNNILRPSMYNAYHKIEVASNPSDTSKTWQIAGPICESSDILGLNRKLPISKDSTLLIHDCGAYASSMANNYNGHFLAPEVLLANGNHSLIKSKQTFQQQIDSEISFI